MSVQVHFSGGNGTLPESWAITKLGDVANVATGSTPKRTEAKYWDEDYLPWLTSSVTGNPYCNQSEQFVSEIAVKECRLKAFKAGTLLLAMYGEGKTRGQVTELQIDAACNQACAAIVANRLVVANSFLKYRLIENYEATRLAASGGNQPNLNLNKVREISIPLPPLAEQVFIAEKLDKLLTKVDSIKARLDAVPDTLKRFRQSVLTAAVSGKLTEEWRKKSSIGGNNYLSDLSEEVKTRRGVPAGVRKNDQISSFDFPKSWGIWSIASLLRKGVIVDLKDGNHGSNHPKASEFTSKGLPFITAAQMDAKGNIDYINAPKVSGEPLSKLKVGFAHEGDVIYSHKGTVGRVSICSRDCVLSPQTTYIRLDTNYVNNSYYKIMCMSDVFTKQVDAIKSQTTRDFVPITTHYTLFAAIPTISEQIEIVRRVEKLFAYADKVEAEVNAAQQRVNKLTQSILAKAFRGELTAKWREQNPDLISGDNSAEALLAKIKAEREKLKPKKKTRTRKKA